MADRIRFAHRTFPTPTASQKVAGASPLFGDHRMIRPACEINPDAEGVAAVICRAGQEALHHGIVYDERYF